MVKLTQLAGSLDGWPSDPLQTTAIQCAGAGFIEYQRLLEIGEKLEELDDVQNNSDEDNKEETENNTHKT